MTPEQHLRKFFNGQTIRTAELICAEHGRTYDYYLCFVRDDGERLMVGSTQLIESSIHRTPGTIAPRPTAEQMRRAPSYFTADDIAEYVRVDEQRRLDRIKQERRQKLAEFERLRRELEDEL